MTARLDGARAYDLDPADFSLWCPCYVVCHELMRGVGQSQSRHPETYAMECGYWGESSADCPTRQEIEEGRMAETVVVMTEGWGRLSGGVFRDRR